MSVENLLFCLSLPIFFFRPEFEGVLIMIFDHTFRTILDLQICPRDRN